MAAILATIFIMQIYYIYRAGIKYTFAHSNLHNEYYALNFLPQLRHKHIII